MSGAIDADAPEVDAAAAYVGEGWLRATVLGEFTAAEEGELSVAEKECVLVDGDQMPPTVELMAAEDDGGDAQLVVANCWLRAVKYEDGGADGPVPAGEEGALPSTYVHLEDFEIRAEEDYDAQADGEISFRRGDVLLVRPAARMLGRSWWLARVRWVAVGDDARRVRPRATPRPRPALAAGGAPRRPRDRVHVARLPPRWQGAHRPGSEAGG